MVIVDLLTSLQEIFDTNKRVTDNNSNGIIPLIESIHRQRFDVTSLVRLLHVKNEIQFVFIVMILEETCEEYPVFRESIQEFSDVKMSKITKQITSLLLELKNDIYSEIYSILFYIDGDISKFLYLCETSFETFVHLVAWRRYQKYNIAESRLVYQKRLPRDISISQKDLLEERCVSLLTFISTYYYTGREEMFQNYIEDHIRTKTKDSREMYILFNGKEIFRGINQGMK
jgi:hypothetical protein